VKEKGVFVQRLWNAQQGPHRLRQQIFPLQRFNNAFSWGRGMILFQFELI